MKKWTPKEGDGFFELKSGEHYVIRSVLTVGGWAHNSPDPNDKPDDIVGVSADSKLDGSTMRFKLDEIRHETFLEFLTRPTGFGRTKWGQFALIVAFLIAGHVASIITWKENGWVFTILLFIVKLGLMWATWRNYQGKQA